MHRSSSFTLKEQEYINSHKVYKSVINNSPNMGKHIKLYELYDEYQQIFPIEFKRINKEEY